MNTHRRRKIYGIYKLIGVLIVVLGFALKLDSILIIFLAAVTTALAGVSESTVFWRHLEPTL